MYSKLILRSIFLIFSTIASDTFAANSQLQFDKVKIQQTINRAQVQIMSQQIDGKYWSYPGYLGTMYLSQYFLIQKWLEIPSASSQLDVNFLKNKLIDTQLKDGSWEILHDENREVGNINATITNYAALKAMGMDTNSLATRKARAFILENGGIEKSSLFTKVVLALFNNYSWENIPKIPYLIFNENFPLNYHKFGQWIGPHLFSIAYLRKNTVYKDLGPLYNLNELYIKTPGDLPLVAHKNSKKTTIEPSSKDQKLIQKILNLQKNHGSFGGYTSATLFSLMAFDHFNEFNKDLSSQIENAKSRALLFVENMYLHSGKSAYLGVTCDGRYWDAALIGQGLLESGIPTSHLASVSNYLLSNRDPISGGFGFGLDFEKYMDTDDTAEILLFLNKQGVRGNEVNQALDWLTKMQNKDGGWGAFDKNNNGNFILSLFTRDFLDSADMYDESSADVTGHILEAFGELGFNLKNSKFLKKSVRYLRKQQTDDGTWLARWGVNYIYGTSAAVIGLISIGVSVDDPAITKARDWLLNCHNEDGGYGESFYSYTDKNYQCHGKSSPTQTAWALMGLLAAGQGSSEVAEQAAFYLVKIYEEEGDWIDKSFVGTGHPRIVPMSYPSYSRAFTLMALSRYLVQQK
jgi:squalene-hopene/tetraprenyl-beta-curcumene cyclase